MCEVDEQHPFVQHELLMPVIPLFRVRDAAEAIAAALRVEHGFHHTATMHSTNIDNMAAMARVCNCSIFVKNDASYAGLGLGGEGYTSFTIATPDRRGPDHRRSLHARAPLHVERSVPVRVTARGPALGVLEIVDDRARRGRRRCRRSSARRRCCCTRARCRAASTS